MDTFSGSRSKLDDAFREDECRLRMGYAAQNFVVLRHLAFNLLKREWTLKIGVNAKQLNARLDEEHLLAVLLG
jgi:hypothetical protein